MINEAQGEVLVRHTILSMRNIL